MGDPSHWHCGFGIFLMKGCSGLFGERASYDLVLAPTSYQEVSMPLQAK